ncbi:hypothetical protein A3J90_01060 [candidate division WOR-1 bacterium RIFOXYC2_FULL_37_10]|uniref:Cell division protein FtsL n=1 Tax=candidate division WOR-1 bacterium RIFOXYB2_FULL_37_13 TaxID=1802579 RepID=A0A1F4SVS6_UNCSA|nr:MAG: hypothetical protein A2246_04300 [candidate division WOR-1 bacterium RIFOXYA2_FULL_37_7]OGC23803.1 MAG: hypothetical protein A2310_04215 [candidate division WOR-1 bacterium RIFOXYB2_FULL_37_13]OGC33295.1 MAG: hypothetical protein A3J90_01060 [candidate division WOR-1 bacterium RIFOXYC2_FULL_37_10]
MKVNLWIVLLVLLLSYLLLLVREDLIQNKMLKNNKQWAESKIDNLSWKNTELNNSLNKIKTAKTIEKLARERLNFTKKGEIAFKICQ